MRYRGRMKDILTRANRSVRSGDTVDWYDNDTYLGTIFDDDTCAFDGPYNDTSNRGLIITNTPDDWED